MAQISMTFLYYTGLRQPLFTNARLSGTWDSAGRFSDTWTDTPMEAFQAEDGAPAFRATVIFAESDVGKTFHWGVRADAPRGSNLWIIPTELSDPASMERYRTFTLSAAGGEQRYYLTHCRRLGANKLFLQGNRDPAIRFAVWAPNARKVEVVRGNLESAYIDDAGNGITTKPDESPAVIPMLRRTDADIWETDVTTTPALNNFQNFDHKPYMFRVTRDDGSVAYRTDLYSRCQLGRGEFNPQGKTYSGTWRNLDGSKSCSNVVNPELVVCDFARAAEPAPNDWVDETAFWRDEFRPGFPMPKRIEDLVIYEMHVGSLGGEKECGACGRLQVGSFKDAMDLLGYLADLGVNAIELLPMGQFQGSMSWGYGTSHYMAIEFANGGRDQFKHFVRACHRHGMAVILDVVYNHYIADGDRDEWMYDTNNHERNIYYWYESRPGGYPNDNPPGHGGYIDNMSTGYAPRYWEEMVRTMFISSAAMLISEFHIDGFRVDQTTSIHSYPVLHADGSSSGGAKAFGVKFLREWCRTLRLIKPNVFLMAEDHSGWDKVTQDTETGGLGFDAVWYADYYHHLIGDAQNDSSRARLLWAAGFGDDRELAMDRFAHVLWVSQFGKVVYHESHDEAGNSSFREGDRDVHSARTLVVAVNNAPLIGETRRWAEARTRVVAGVTLLSPGIPMFFMGEEVGAAKPFTHDNFIHNREDLPGLRATTGAYMFKFYQDILALRSHESALRTKNVDILHVHNQNRILVFRRQDNTGDLLIALNLNHVSYTAYDVINDRIPRSNWNEVLNSNNPQYNGWGNLNNGQRTADGHGKITLALPGNSIVVLKRQ
ncbi:MAG: alpha amylase C-terminal domain-containing protein [Magnetococcales bacterium]|nr:alpha amylase C-terminal domain-containing protein [Magnetococcales bacterium]